MILLKTVYENKWLEQKLFLSKCCGNLKGLLWIFWSFMIIWCLLICIPKMRGKWFGFMLTFITLWKPVLKGYVYIVLWSPLFRNLTSDFWVYQILYWNSLNFFTPQNSIMRGRAYDTNILDFKLTLYVF